jgi:hypothetical protein
MNIQTTSLLLAALAVGITGTHAANAQTPTEESPVIALQPTPHTAGCGDFSPAGNGMWHSNGPIVIRNTITIGPSAAFGEGVSFAGIDLAKWLNEKCPK